MEPYDALVRDLQRVCTKPHGLLARAIAAIATLREQAKTWEERADYLRERCEDFRKRNDYLQRVQTDRNDDQKTAQIRQEMEELRADRDALRRTLSRMYIDPNAFAESKNWDCFKENSK
jgi:predicted RNase H-like nuclease (RuvC/YqgF family)